ncbi:DUF4134 domain-containing protein [Hymenobacter sp. UV11]|uniref:DUF4134 domain-containing protein n=1 Tax=Hymenobacter sp. UV11 TaxID=1849735 RepID=UPI00105D5109|nr:DUF4134 domain-containing protein [Hymenobacter sp. UV11]TDN39876.1 conjugal transfer protein [Hymenobacter sp. UV11]TFZ63211.1 DUF4134 domain-containing protein [Hymenobacter sp. UV11]
MKKKQILTTVAVLGLMLCTQVVFAQGGGAAGGASGINDATQQVTNYFDPLTKLMYAIGAVLGLIGAIKVYSKWNAGDQDTQKTAVSWFGSMIFLVLVATVVRSFFL